MNKQPVRFYEKGHYYECEGENYISVSQLIGLFSEEYDEEAWSWYIAIKLWYIGDFWNDKKGRMYMEDTSIKAHYPLDRWSNEKTGQARKFLIKGTLQKEYLYKFIDGISYRVELAILKQKVLDRWKYFNVRASEGGTKYHNEREAESIFKKYGIHIDEFKAKEKAKGYKESYIDLYKEITDGEEPELLGFHHGYKIAGQMDKPIFRTKGQSRYVKIFDHKTNFDGIPKTNPFGHKFKSPINHIPECKFYHYALQQSAYGFMLEEAGFIYEGGVLQWVKVDFDTGEVLDEEDIPVPYLREEVISMFNYYKDYGKKIAKKSIWD